MTEPTFSTVQDQQRRELAEWKNRAEAAEAALRKIEVLADMHDFRVSVQPLVDVLDEHKVQFPEAWFR